MCDSCQECATGGPDEPVLRVDALPGGQAEGEGEEEEDSVISELVEVEVHSTIRKRRERQRRESSDEEVSCYSLMYCINLF